MTAYEPCPVYVWPQSGLDCLPNESAYGVPFVTHTTWVPSPMSHTTLVTLAVARTVKPPADAVRVIGPHVFSEAPSPHIQVGSPMMLVFELLPPAPRQQEWFPGMAGRIARANEEHGAVVERLGLSHVRMYNNSEVVARLYGDDQAAATPDGFHFTPELHRAIGAALAEQIGEWAETQPHLRVGQTAQPHLAPARDNAG